MSLPVPANFKTLRASYSSAYSSSSMYLFKGGVMYSNTKDKDKFQHLGVKIENPLAEDFKEKCSKYKVTPSEVLRGLIAKFNAGEIVLTKTIGG